MKSKLIFLVLVLVICCLIYVFINLNKNLLLIAESSVPIFESKQGAMSWPKEKAFTNLEPQQKVILVSCIDVKHYQIFEIKLDDGRIGFINEGKYIILKDGKPSVC